MSVAIKRFNSPHPSTPSTRKEFLKEYLEVNARINNWYHNIDQKIRDWIGDPALPNWASFAKFVSLNAGRGVSQMNDTLIVLDQLCELREALDTQQIPLLKREVSDITRQIFGCIFGGVRLLMQDLRTGTSPIQTIGKLKGIAFAEASDREGISFHWPDSVHSRVTPCDLPRTMLQVFRFPHLYRDAIEKIMVAVSDANRAIYSYMLINLSIFEDAIANNPDCPIEQIQFMDDPQGFFQAAFVEYARARSLTDKLTRLEPESIEFEECFIERLERVKFANLLITFNEQAFRVQPLYAGLDKIIDVLFDDAKIIRDNRPFHLLADYSEGNWADVLTRMGLCPEGVNSLSDITPENFPKVLPQHDPRYNGTIAAYFEEVYQDPDELNSLTLPPH